MTKKTDNFKVDKILFAANMSKYFFHYQAWYSPLKRSCRRIIGFDSRKLYYQCGKEKMNEKFLEVVKKEKPDYIFFLLFSDEFSLETLMKIRELSPDTKTINFFGDDDIQFDNFSRYYALFFDYSLIVQKKYIDYYKKDGINNIFLTTGVNLDNFKPLSLEKKYDVTFIGAPKQDRYDFICYLRKNGINVNVFGWGWEKYNDLKDICGGVLSSEELVKTVNQSRINLSFSKNARGESHIKGRIFEMSACKSFLLIESFMGYYDFFKKEKEIVMFKDKEELLEKIKYYLKHEEEREKIAENAYKRILREYNLDTELSNFFSMTEKRKNRRKLPEIKGKTMLLTKKDFELSEEELKKKIKDYDYIHFNDGNTIFSPYKEYLQAYSLEKTGNQISCCDFYVNSVFLGDYLLFYSLASFNDTPRQKFLSLITINQVMVTKDFFIKNLKLLKDFFMGKKKDFINKNTISFVSIPLLRIRAFRPVDYINMEKSFQMKFLHKIYSLKFQKNPFTLFYIFALSLNSAIYHPFILKNIIYNIFNKSNWNKLNKLSKE
jgi:spore maturation protein CgeB